MSKQDKNVPGQLAGDDGAGNPGSPPAQGANMGRGGHGVNPGQGEESRIGGQWMHHFQYPPHYAAPGWLGYGHVGSSPPGSAPGLDSMGPRRGANAPGMAQVMQEIAGGGIGLSSLSKLLDFDDKDFWKGALVGAAAVLLLTNDGVQRALFRGAVKGRDTVQEGVDKVKASVNKVGRKANQQADTANE